MNLAKLFETQRILDERILEQHPELKGQNNLDWKILALQVELGECANEWRGFKKWSNDQEPRVEEDVPCSLCDGTGDLNYERIQENAEGTGNHEFIECIDCDCTGVIGVRNQLLEEYVDCLHFILSIGIELDLDIEDWAIEGITYHSIITQFIALNEMVASLFKKPFETKFIELLEIFIGLGEMLEFEWEQIEQAYYEKNEINHERQSTGY